MQDITFKSTFETICGIGLGRAATSFLMTVTSVCLLIVFRSVFAVNSMGDDALAPEKKL